jgi:protein SCO1/2
MTILALMAFPGAAPQVRARGSAGEVGVDEQPGGLVDLDAPLKDEEGKDVTLRQLVDRPTILTLNYFSCAGICTPLLNGVLEMMNRIEMEPGKDFQVITVSFDDRDTPEMAKKKRDNYFRLMKRPILPTGWRFLTGTAAATRRVADSVGFRFKRVAKENGPKEDWYEYVHPGAIMLLSPKGKITRYMYGTTFLPADVQMAVGEAARGEVQATIPKLLQFCYSFDPEGRRYVFSMTRVVGLFMGVLVAGFVIFLFIQGRIRKQKQ